MNLIELTPHGHALAPSVQAEARLILERLIGELKPGYAHLFSLDGDRICPVEFGLKPFLPPLEYFDGPWISLEARINRNATLLTSNDLERPDRWMYQPSPERVVELRMALCETSMGLDFFWELQAHSSLSPQPSSGNLRLHQPVIWLEEPSPPVAGIQIIYSNEPFESDPEETIFDLDAIDLEALGHAFDLDPRKPGTPHKR